VASANGHIYGYASNGALLSGWPQQYSAITTTESSPVIADMDGDGSLDIILGDESVFINAWDASGNNVPGFPLGTTDALRSVPAVADLDGNGDPELVASGWDKTVYVWDFKEPYSEHPRSWPQFHANVHNNGLVGAVIPTGVQEASFAFEVVGDAVDLSWLMPSAAGYIFDIYRAADGEETFMRIASGLGMDGGQQVRYVDRDVEPGARYVYRIDESDGEQSYRTQAVYIPVRAAGMTQNYPNPFNPVTRITYWVPEGAAQRVDLVIYDVRGARVRTLVAGNVPGGRHLVEWDGRNDQGQAVGSGVYFYRMVQRNYKATRKMLLLK
jgi:hypothetical protein